MVEKILGKKTHQKCTFEKWNRWQVYNILRLLYIGAAWTLYNVHCTMYRAIWDLLGERSLRWAVSLPLPVGREPLRMAEADYRESFEMFHFIRDNVTLFWSQTSSITRKHNSELLVRLFSLPVNRQPVCRGFENSIEIKNLIPDE